MTEPVYHQVLCSLTEQEYHRKARDDDQRLQHRPLLYRTSRGNGDAIHEDDITLLLRDALILTAADGAASDALHQKDRDDFDATALPFALKAELMQWAAEHWEPPRQVLHNLEPSFWSGPGSEARRLLESHPELRLVFEQTPEEVAKVWEARQSPRPARTGKGSKTGGPIPKNDPHSVPNPNPATPPYPPGPKDPANPVGPCITCQRCGRPTGVKVPQTEGERATLCQTCNTAMRG